MDKKPLDLIAEHIWATLPDSFNQRKALLEALLALGAKGQTAQNSRDLLFHLNQHELKQRELFS
ncbi:MAG: hypothetical protein H7Y43_08025 [Akkermansiaceae bacterium]|nr:hypothetical protein [Verrucomicrobiales bacterium]